MTQNYSTEALAELYQNPDKLQQVVALADKQVKLEKEIELTEDALKQLKEDLANVAGGVVKGEVVEGHLPSLLTEVGLSSLTLQPDPAHPQGIKIEIKDDLQQPSMAKDSDKREPVCDWMENNGHSGVVKNTVYIPFSKDQKELVEELEKFLQEKFKGLQYDKYRTIHPQTLKKILGEILKDGEQIPLSEFEIFRYKKTKIGS